jgi:hypothetical protein
MWPNEEEEEGKEEKRNSEFLFISDEVLIEV